MIEKVWELLDHNAVMPIVGWEDRACVVHGATGTYLVKNGADGVHCNCQAGSTGVQCSHSIAAQIVWFEQMEARRGLVTRREDGRVKRG